MLWMVAILVFGVPLIVIIMQGVKKNRDREDRLAEIRSKLAEKNERKIKEKVEAIKSKSQNG
ncbi:hypothetical protein R50072_37940 [Simiduia litorea]|uniref:hypothetical protein n=1 Tax=Simiduia litorea TaxID=1435348 RepID=UPI0036F33A33